MQPIIKNLSFIEKEQTDEHFEELTKKKCINEEAESLDLSIDNQLNSLADIIANRILKELSNDENE